MSMCKFIHNKLNIPRDMCIWINTIDVSLTLPFCANQPSLRWSRTFDVGIFSWRGSFPQPCSPEPVPLASPCVGYLKGLQPLSKASCRKSVNQKVLCTWHNRSQSWLGPLLTRKMNNKTLNGATFVSTTAYTERQHCLAPDWQLDHVPSGKNWWGAPCQR